MKKDADCVLTEVTKKKTDARKYLNLLSALVKLRNVKENAAMKRGERLNLEDRSVFANTSGNFNKLNYNFIYYIYV